MELKNLKVHLRTITTVKEHGIEPFDKNPDEDFKFRRLVEKPPDIGYNFSRINEISLRSIPEAAVNIDPHSTTDLRSLLCGFKLPPDILSTTMRPQYQVYNYLSVSATVRVRSGVSDVTPQKAERVEIAGLINLQRVLYNPFDD